MSYQIVDEPMPGGLARWAVHPLWPLLGVMFGGAWLAWPWFAFNAFAVGSPTRKREAMIAAGGFAGTLAIAFAIVALANLLRWPAAAVSYAVIGLAVWKLAVSYWLFSLQGRSFHLYEHFGGQVRSGLLVLLLAGFLGRRLVLQAVDSGLWRVVLS